MKPLFTERIFLLFFYFFISLFSFLFFFSSCLLYSVPSGYCPPTSSIRGSGTERARLGTFQKISKNCRFLLKKVMLKTWSFAWKIKNPPTYWDFDFFPRPPTSPNFNTQKTFILKGFLLQTNRYINCANN